jgi:hypothetical protein
MSAPSLQKTRSRSKPQRAKPATNFSLKLHDAENAKRSLSRITPMTSSKRF